MTEPWTPGSVPTDCMKCGKVYWFLSHEMPGECCGDYLRSSGSDNKPHAWYADLCASVRAECMASVKAAIERLA